MELPYLLALAFFGCLTLITTLLMLVTRYSSDEKRMLLRFNDLRSRSAATSPTEAEANLLRSIEPVASTWSQLLIARLSTAFKLNLLLLQADSTTTLQKLFGLCLAAGAGGALLTLLFVPVPLAVAAAGLGAAYLPVAFLRIRRMRRMAAFDKALPASIEMMSRALRAGHSMIAAISIVAEHAAEPAKTEFSEVFRKQNFGLPLRDALMVLLDRVPSQDLRLFVTGVLVQKETGGNLAEILDRIVSVIRERLKIQGEIRTHTAQGRLTGWILCLLPIGLLLILGIVNPGYSRPLTTDPLGIKLLYLGAALLALGAYLIKRIIDAIEV